MTPLFKLIKKYAVRHGSFTMASGATNNILIDLSHVLRQADTQRLLTQEVPMELLEMEIDTIGGPVCGSDLIAAPLCQAFVAPRWFGVRKEPKRRGLDNNQITGELNQGDRVLLVEDVITTGNTASQAAEVIQEHGGKIVAVFCLVDRGGMLPLCKKLQVPGFNIYNQEDFF